MPRKPRRHRLVHKKDHSDAERKRKKRAETKDGTSVHAPDSSLHSPSCPSSTSSVVDTTEDTEDNDSVVTTSESNVTDSDDKSVMSVASESECELDLKLHCSDWDSDDNTIMSCRSRSDSRCDSRDSSPAPSVNEQSFNFKVPVHDPGTNVACSSKSAVDFDLAPDYSLLREVKNKLELFLNDNCISVVEKDHIDVLFMSRSEDKVTQRQLTFRCDGKFSLKVHCTPYHMATLLDNVLPPKSLNSSSIGHFVDRMVQIINFVSTFEICTGVAISDYKHVWSECDRGEIDKNPYKESRYSETFRSLQCDRMVNPRRRRCLECHGILKILKRKHELAEKSDIHPNTPNIFLSETQKLTKLSKLRKELDNAKRRIERLKAQRLIDQEGVRVDGDLSGDCTTLLQGLDLDKLVEEEKMTEEQALFIDQQLMALKAKSAKGRRWHPSMIRFALSIFHQSPGTYGALVDSGMMSLPCRRTLFDYTHFKPVQEGIHYEVLDSVTKKLEGLKDYQRYHVIMCDEMYISKNLVYEKSTGKIIGFISLDEVQMEMAALDAFMKDPDAKPARPPLASKILTFFIKGVASDVKEAVATYGVDILTKEQLYRWSWDVITKLERAGAAIIAYISDGSPINRSFIKMNKPFTEGSEVVFDTLNKAAPFNTINQEINKVRPLYFIADVPHLLKTIRNCFYSSSNKRYLNKGTGKMMLRRRLEKKGQKILWSTVMDLYHHQKNKRLRLSYKLNAQNVFLNAYSKMKVKYAAQVLSETVAQHLEELNWDNTKETIIFIRKVNDFFDMMNGAFSQQGARKRNPNLDPYCTEEDERFAKLQEFINYLNEWRDEAVAAGNVTLNESAPASHSDDVDDPTDAPDPVEGDEEETGDPASVRQLSHQTLEGIKIAVKGFTSAVKFLLREGVAFINARVFCQDPLEQYFGKQRSKGGGSTNPNFSRSLISQRTIHLQGQLRTKKHYRGNTEVEAKSMIMSNEPLPKRRKASLQSTEKEK